MADRFVASGGSNTSPYETWAKAATSLATALAASTATGDRIIIQYDAVPAGDAEVAADTTYTFAGNIQLIAASNDGGSAFTPTPMGTANWIGNSTTNFSVTINGGFRSFCYGLTLRTAGSTADSLIIGGASDNVHYELEECYLWNGNTATTSGIFIGTAGGNVNSYLRLKNCTFRISAAAQRIYCRARIDIVGGSLSSAGTAPTTVVFEQTTDNAGGKILKVDGMDLSHAGSCTVVGNGATGAWEVTLSNCKLGTSFVPFTASPTPTNLGGTDVLYLNCHSGDQHYHLIHANAFGTLTSDTAITWTSGGALYDGTNPNSWKIVTTANCHYCTPYRSPKIAVYHDATSAITPYLEILRDGSTTAYQDDEVWGEFSYQGTSGFPLALFADDRKTLAAAAANQAAGAGTGSWSGEAGSAWSGKVDTGGTITPAEIGHLTARLVVGEPSITVYLDPTIRGRS